MDGETRDIIVVGASAGGIEVLIRLVRSLPSDLPASVFIVVHRGPYDGRLADVLGRNGCMATVFAKHQAPIVQQRIYVAPPNHHLTLKYGQTNLSIGPKVNRHRPAVDPLFESAAREYGKRVIGVVLSGYLDDGTVGLAAIKDRGGLAVVQNPKEAFAPDMPRNAMLRVTVDYCLNAADIPPLLIRLVNGENNLRK